jgi:spore coat polysaccharide biosynthesis protein SpsF
MGEIHRCSRRYILAGEYFGEQREEVPYRGESGALFRDDYGARYQRLFPDLELVDKRYISWAESQAWDDMTFWTFEKRAG